MVMSTHLNDAELISGLGGPSKVAELIGLSKKGGAQRVQNWLSRGIPARIKVKHPALFMPELAQAPATIEPKAIESVATPVAQAIGVQRRQGGRRERFLMSKET